MKGIVLFLIMVILSHSLYVNQTYMHERSYGVWSEHITAQNTLTNDPSTYAVCGFAVRQFKQIKKQSFPQFSKNLRIDCCESQQQFQVILKMSDGIKVTFCSYNNWNNQITKSFTVKNSSNSQQQVWTKAMCPQGQYATNVANRFGQFQGYDIGFIGLQIKCQELDSNVSSLIQNNNGFWLSPMSNKTNKYLTAVQVKYVEDKNLVGIRQVFEGISIVSGMTIAYGQPSFLGNVSTVEIQTKQVDNTGQWPQFFSINFSRTYKVGAIWTNEPSIITRYGMANDIIIWPLEMDRGNVTETIYKPTIENIVFGRQVMTTYTPFKTFSVMVARCSSAKVITKIKQQTIVVPYEITYNLTDSSTNQTIAIRKVKGYLNGTRASIVQTDVLYSNITNCQEQ